MEKRRQFLKSSLGLFTGLGVMFSPLYQAAQAVYGRAQNIIVPRDADRSRLKHRDPAQLDTRNLDLTALEEFQNMGDSDFLIKTIERFDPRPDRL